MAFPDKEGDACTVCTHLLHAAVKMVVHPAENVQFGVGISGRGMFLLGKASPQAFRYRVWGFGAVAA